MQVEMQVFNKIIILFNKAGVQIKLFFLYSLNLFVENMYFLCKLAK